MCMEMLEEMGRRCADFWIMQEVEVDGDWDRTQN
jgi:hypothetical protein